MMTPLDIQTKSFSNAPLGYKKTEVDSFTEEVLTNYETLYKSYNEANEKIKALSVKYGFTYVDMHAVLTDESDGEYSSLYTDDGLHPNAAGYERITEVLLPVIENELRK